MSFQAMVAAWKLRREGTDAVHAMAGWGLSLIYVFFDSKPKNLPFPCYFLRASELCFEVALKKKPLECKMPCNGV